MAPPSNNGGTNSTHVTIAFLVRIQSLVILETGTVGTGSYSERDLINGLGILIVPLHLSMDLDTHDHVILHLQIVRATQNLKRLSYGRENGLSQSGHSRPTSWLSSDRD